MPNELLYELSEWGSVDEVAIAYEGLGKTITNNQKVYQIWLYASIAFVFFGIVWLQALLSTGEWMFTPLVFIFLGASFYWAFVTTKESYWKLPLSNGRYVFILKNMPSEEEVDELIDAIYAQRDIYLNEEYGVINPLINYDVHLDNFKFLKRLDVWDEERYKMEKDKLDATFGQKKQLIGFSYQQK